VNLDPSREPASGIGDIFADGPDDRAVLPDSADDDGWRNAAGEVWLAGGTTCCSTVVRDRSVSRGRKPCGIPGPSKTVAAELLLRELPSVIAAGGLDNGSGSVAGYNQLVCGNLTEVCHTGTQPLERLGPGYSRLRCPPYTVRAVDWMIGRMIRACGADDVEWRSGNYVF